MEGEIAAAADATPQLDLFPPTGCSVFIEPAGAGDDLQYVGELESAAMTPVPCELYIEIAGWTYVFKIDRRYQDGAATI